MLRSWTARFGFLLGVIACACMFISFSAANAGDAAPRALLSPAGAGGLGEWDRKKIDFRQLKL
jgi:hypothetical protein